MKKLSWASKLLCRVVQSGKIPNHIAFIMDGNRRFATTQNLSRHKGHLFGFHKLEETLQWCSELGIKNVTVYAFSIENYKRPKKEVQTLMNLAKKKFQSVIDDPRFIAKLGIKIRIVGERSLIPKELKIIGAKVEQITKQNTKGTLNVCLSYTSRNEIVQGIRDITSCLQENKEQSKKKNNNKDQFLNNNQIDTNLFDQCLLLSDSGKPDLLVRTSGECRLSDFMLWQVSDAVISFLPAYWPDFKLHHLLWVILWFQQKEKSKKNNTNQTKLSQENQKILETIKKKRAKKIDKYAQLYDQEYLTNK
ncbi:dehydrodolichyl diphosphate synthase complex subunit DHDDS [Anaeramoeba flamelloides]|uniref:Alkyl transferase n=1 Tax=Anaeramoeba flamelloides TaxID=1746091 RepID=A0ABQ8XR05_9EUKA|nr:dehydrodolichyl diphosphate synthase complex subunit DHDDS [Anaeramoeba flamelloides]